jgi:thioredoxin-like negative regulator of GroEL
MTGLTTNLLLQTLLLATGAQPYEQAYRTMESDGQPLLVLVGADWCPACQSMKSSTMVRLERSGKLRGVAYTIVNSDRESSLAQKIMRGGSIPQLVLYERTASGWRRSQLTGGQSESQVQAFIARAVASSQAKIATASMSSAAPEDAVVTPAAGE